MNIAAAWRARSALLGGIALVVLAACGDDDGDVALDAGGAGPDARADAPGPIDAAPDAALPRDAHTADAPPSLARVSDLECEATEPSGPIPDPPTTRVADFGDPVRLSFDDPCVQDAIEVSPDGRRIYHHYSVDRLETLIEQGRAAEGTEIRFVELAPDGTWQAPRHFALDTGDPGALHGELRVARDRSWVVWHALSADNYGFVEGLPPGQTFDLDLYEATISQDVPALGVHLGREVNSVYLEGEHWVTDDGRTLYFSSNRAGGLGGVDVWVVARDAAGVWDAPRPLPAPVGSPANDLQPTISPDGEWMYFTSDRGPPGIWRVPLAPDGSLGADAELVIAPFAGEPSFADDGRLFFVHVELDAGVPYDADVYYVDPR